MTSIYPQQNNVERRKRLGQYFTGDKLARLLTLIAKRDQCFTAIDPMCGSGDIIAAVMSIVPPARVVGIEIDPNVMALCANRFKKETQNIPYLIEGNAFSWEIISRLPFPSFDLVITNPPYVRYQSLAGNRRDSELDLPGAESIRHGLLEVAQGLSGLTDEDREIFISIIKGYSGLSDLAVPSWILCAMLTAMGGSLAMVVPESWLSRDYAHPIHYLLLKLFRIRWVIEDAHSIWFEDALVKTNLIVAQRIPQAENIIASCSGRSYLHVTLPSSTIDSRSIVGGLYPDSKDPDVTFAQQLVRWDTGKNIVCPDNISLTRRSLQNKFAELVAASSKSKWLRYCEPTLTKLACNLVNRKSGGIMIPQALFDLLQHDTCDFTTLEMLGGKVGQGLRTGANAFFYCDLISEMEDGCLVRPGKILGIQNTFLPKEVLQHVLRKQNEVSNGYQLDQSKLQGRVLILENFVHPDELRKMDGKSKDEIVEMSGRRVMPQTLAAFVTAAGRTNIGTKENPKFIPQLSAVRTNETKKKGNDDATVRYWYMLPPLARRHLPDLFVPRINHLHPKVMMNSFPRTVIDANFSTIWLEPGAVVDAYALLSFLNSSWALVAMELIATVMGGGALKLEAAHLRKLPIPVLSSEQWAVLSALGRSLTSGQKVPEILFQINWLIGLAVFGEERAESALKTIEKIKIEKLATRQKKVKREK